MLLAAVSSSAAANWVPVDEIETNTTITYVDLSTILKKGDTVRMWSLNDYDTFQFAQFGLPEPYLSTSHQYEYDCKAKRLRRFSFSFHSGNMAQGKVVSRSTATSNWELVRPDTVNETLWKLACGKR